MRVALVLIAFSCLYGCATDDSISDRRYGQQLVCHKGHTMAVSNADSFTHQDHGDKLGPCPKDQ
jgi:hypothetical protein